MKNYIIALIVMALLNGCAKKGEDQLIGKWSFSATVTDGDDKPQAISCNIDFKKDSTYKEDCLIDYTNDGAKGSMIVSTFGDWIYKKEEKTDGYFLIKPKERGAKVITWKQNELNFSEALLKEMNDQDFLKQKDKLSADSEIKFTVISEKNSKLFIQIDSSSEDEFPIGSFSMEKYDERNDKVKSAPDLKPASKKEGKSQAAAAPDNTIAEAPSASAQQTKNTLSESIETDLASILNLGNTDKTKWFMKDAKEGVRYIKSLNPSSYFVQFGAFNTARECFEYENDFLRNLESLYVKSDSPRFLRIPLLTKDRKPAVAIVFGPFDTVDDAKSEISGDGQIPPKHWVRSTQSLKDVAINLQ